MRRSAWVGKVTALFAALVLSGPIPSAQGPPSASEAQILNCQVDEHLPPEPAVAEDGGYRFQYQSIRGVTADGRVCTLYRVRNTSDHPPTPLRWLQGDELLMDKTRLARCPADAASCPWLHVARYFEGHVDTNLSLIRYGLNADAYDQQAETFLGTTVLDEARATRSVGTELEGVFANAAGEPVEVHLIVKSRVEPDADGRPTAVLEITDLGGRADLASSLLRVEWDALTATDAALAAVRAAPAEDLAGVVVEAAPPSAGVVAPAPAAEGARAAMVVRSPDTFEVVLDAPAYELRRDFALSVYFREEAEPLVTVEMPAFLPTRAEP